MAHYRYKATDAQGNRQTGEVEAAGAQQAAAQLAEAGLSVEELSPLEPAAAGQGRGRLSEHDVAELARHVSGLDRAGLPLHSGLRALGEELSSGSLRRLLFDVAGQLEAGRSLDEAL